MCCGALWPNAGVLPQCSTNSSAGITRHLGGTVGTCPQLAALSMFDLLVGLNFKLHSRARRKCEFITAVDFSVVLPFLLVSVAQCIKASQTSVIVLALGQILVYP